jgi:hypothetical protein
LILKDAILGCFRLGRAAKAAPRKEKREQAPAFQTWFSTGSIIAGNKKSQEKVGLPGQFEFANYCYDQENSN